MYKMVWACKSNAKDIISTNHVDGNKSSDKMLIPGGSVLQCNVIQTNLGLSRIFK